MTNEQGLHNIIPHIQSHLTQVWEFGVPDTGVHTIPFATTASQNMDHPPFLLRHLTTGEMERQAQSLGQQINEQVGQTAAAHDDEAHLERLHAMRLEARYAQAIRDYVMRRSVVPATSDNWHDTPYSKQDQDALRHLELVDAIKAQRAQAAGKQVGPLVRLGLSSSGYHRKISNNRWLLPS